MRSLRRRFNNITKRNPYWSSYICFLEAIKGQNFNKQTTYRWFNKLVEKDDYDRKNKRIILKHLIELGRETNNTTENNQF